MQYGGSNIFFLEVMTNVNLKNKIGQMSRSNIKYQHKDLITINIHVKYQSSGTHYSNFFLIARLKYSKSVPDSKVKLLVSMEKFFN